ncbi:MAG: hypothetical protein MJ170_00880 [Alphaproteobacteria bacterium]|nr:hypothetical protein [Alphaproteobacteria bacterium]
MSEKVSVNQQSNKKERNVIISGYAWWLVVIGALFSGCLNGYDMRFGIQNEDIMFWSTILIGFIMGLIPVCLATFLEKKHRAYIYWLSFFSVWMPLGIFVWAIAVIWAIFDKKRI